MLTYRMEIQLSSTQLNKTKPQHIEWKSNTQINIENPPSLRNRPIKKNFRKREGMGHTILHNPLQNPKEQLPLPRNLTVTQGPHWARSHNYNQVWGTFHKIFEKYESHATIFRK